MRQRVYVGTYFVPFFGSFMHVGRFVIRRFDLFVLAAFFLCVAKPVVACVCGCTGRLVLV